MSVCIRMLCSCEIVTGLLDNFRLSISFNLMSQMNCAIVSCHDPCVGSMGVAQIARFT